jgi:hypothetical protein
MGLCIMIILNYIDDVVNDTKPNFIHAGQQEQVA